MSAGVPASRETLQSWTQQRLAQIEVRLQDAATGQTSFVTEVARHLTLAGGKRFRPSLVAAAAAIGHDLGTKVDDDAVERAAVVVELTHVASLYHDDVMDSAELRRAAPSANAVWDNSVAIMVGDLLFARASTIVATLGVEFVTVQAETFARLVQGQIAELLGPEHSDPLQHYLGVIADKTGSLIATSARFGGMVSGLSEPQLDALTRFGEEIGVVFQLSDDLIDLTSDVAGKTRGTDLREGVRTLATLFVATGTDPADEELRDLVSRPLTDLEVARALTLLEGHPAVQRAREEIVRRAETARSHLEQLPPGAARDALGDLCTTVVTRAS